MFTIPSSYYGWRITIHRAGSETGLSVTEIRAFKHGYWWSELFSFDSADIEIWRKFKLSMRSARKNRRGFWKGF